METVKDFNNNDLVPNNNFEIEFKGDIELSDNLRIYSFSADIIKHELHVSFIYNESEQIMKDIFSLVNSQNPIEVIIKIYNRSAEKLVNTIILAM